MEMKTRSVGDIQILSLIGRFDTTTASPIASWLDQMTATPRPRIIINLAETTFVDSTGLATLVQALKRCQRIQGELALCDLRRPVYMIFELTRLDQAFSIYVDEEQALQALADRV